MEHERGREGRETFESVLRERERVIDIISRRHFEEGDEVVAVGVQSLHLVIAMGFD